MATAEELLAQGYTVDESPPGLDTKSLLSQGYTIDAPESNIQISSEDIGILPKIGGYVDAGGKALVKGALALPTIFGDLAVKPFMDEQQEAKYSPSVLLNKGLNALSGTPEEYEAIRPAGEQFLGKATEFGSSIPSFGIFGKALQATKLPVVKTIGSAFSANLPSQVRASIFGGLGAEAGEQIAPDSNVAPIIGALTGAGGYSALENVGKNIVSGAGKVAQTYENAALDMKKSDYRVTKKNPLYGTKEAGYITKTGEAAEGLKEMGALKYAGKPDELKDWAKGVYSNLNDEISGIIENVDQQRPEGVRLIPQFDEAEKYVNKANVADDQRASLRDELKKYKTAFKTETDGSLLHIQNQKKALGAEGYDIRNPGLREAIYQDLKRTVEEVSATFLPAEKAEAIKELNKKISNFIQFRPIIDRQVAQAGKETLGQKAKGLFKTGSIYGAPTFLGGLFGGPGGALLGLGAGKAVDLAHSPRGLVAQSKVLRGINSLAPKNMTSSKFPLLPMIAESTQTTQTPPELTSFFESIRQDQKKNELISEPEGDNLISDKGQELIKKQEGLRLSAYKDVAGVPTIGYGHTKTAKAGEKITEEKANELFAEDLNEAEAAIDSLVKVPLRQNERDALASLIYNIGPGAFKKSTLLRLLNEGDKEGVAKEFSKWVHAGGKVVKGLQNRRLAESKLFSEGVY